MKDLLHCKDLYVPLEGHMSRSKDVSNDDCRRLHRKGIRFIQ